MAGLLMLCAALLAGVGCASVVGLAAGMPRFQAGRRGVPMVGEFLRLAELVGHSRPGRVLPKIKGADSLSRSVSAWLERRGRRVSPQGALAAYAMSSCLVTLALCLVSASALGLVVGAAACAGAAAGVVGARERRQRDLYCAQMPEALRCLSGALGAGKSLSQAIDHAGRTLPDPMGSEFLQASFEIKAGGPPDKAVDGLCSRVDAPGIALLGAALQISQRTGSSLNELFAQTAQIASDSASLHRELEVKTSQVRLSAKVVAAMPAVLCGFLTLLSGDYRAGLALPAGRACLAVAVLLDVCALMLVRRVMAGSLR